MKDLLNSPIASDEAHIADLVELMALKASDNDIALEDIHRLLGRASDYPDKSGPEAPDDEEALTSSDAFVDLATRSDACGNEGHRYPFILDRDLLKLEISALSNSQAWLYIFLLLATRMNMSRDKTQSVGSQKIDGTQLFEHICLAVAKAYFGGEDDRTSGIVFGTSRASWTPSNDEGENENQFRMAVADLCIKLGEGGDYQKNTDTTVPKDDGIDVVAWRGFADGRAGKLIAFCQCKTGTSWKREDVTRLDPQAFCKSWLKTVPPVTPIRLFFVAQRIWSPWLEYVLHSVILFDRCRIVQYAYLVPDPLLANCKAWSIAALKSQGITVPA